MYRLFVVCALLAFTYFSQSACGQSKKSVTKSSKTLVLKAWKQRTLPGRKEGAVQTNYGIILRLSNALTAPVYFRSTEGWWACEVIGARFDRQSSDFQPVASKSFQKGDTVLIFTKGPVDENTLPKHIKPNTLIYKQQQNVWQTVPISTIERRDDVAMP